MKDNVIKFPKEKQLHRPLYEIAKEVLDCWPKINPHAKAYIVPLLEVNAITDMYILDPASGVVRRFLCNAQGWRGEDARRIKKELKDILKLLDSNENLQLLAANNHRAAYGIEDNNENDTQH